MKNEQKQELLDKAKEMLVNCYYMHDNAPQEMSNVTLINNVQFAVKKLVEELECM